MATNNRAAAKAALADLSEVFQGLMSADVPRSIIRPGILAGLRVLRDAIRLAAPINRRRVRKATRAFARRMAKMPVGAIASATGPQISGRLRRSVGSRIKVYRGRVEGKSGLNVGKSPTRTPNAYAPHAHLVTLGTGVRFHKSGRNVGRMRRNPFVRRAAAGATSAARAAATTVIRQQIDKRIAKGKTFTRRQRRTIDLLYSV